MMPTSPLVLLRLYSESEGQKKLEGDRIASSVTNCGRGQVHDVPLLPSSVSFPPLRNLIRILWGVFPVDHHVAAHAEVFAVFGVYVDAVRSHYSDAPLITSKCISNLSSFKTQQSQRARFHNTD